MQDFGARAYRSPAERGHFGKNESYAAIDGGSLVVGQEFIADSNKPLEAGDRVRLNQP